MYQSKQNKKEVYSKLKTSLATLGNSEYVKLFLKWESLTPTEKRLSRLVWDKYYKDVRRTRSYFMFKETSAVISNKKQTEDAKVSRKLLLQESRAMLEEQIKGRFELSQPTTINPYDIDSHNGIISLYLSTMSRIKHMQKESMDMELNNIF